MTATITDLIAIWNTDEGKPYKGSLIDMDSYDADQPDKIGCMCAQGQTLHILGGWDVHDILKSSQADADAAVAKLLNISVSHSVLLRQINDTAPGAPSIVLTSPGDVLGDQWSKVLDFWAYLDGMDPAAWYAAMDAAGDAAVYAVWAAAMDAARGAAWYAARDAAWYAAWYAARGAARDAAWYAAWYAARGAARGAVWGAVWASSEIQGAEVMRKKGQPFFFLPLFGFASPDDIPSRSATYGNGVVPA